LALPFILLVLPTRFGPGNLDLLFAFANWLYGVAGKGGFCMIYQAIRYEEKVLPGVVLSLVPFMFVGYRIERYPVRAKLVRAGPS
jgi:hypothetical protein